MDTNNTSVAETPTSGSSSTSSPSSFSSPDTSSVKISKVLEFDTNGVPVGGGGGGAGGESEGFVSGEEEFETEPERPSVGVDPNEGSPVKVDSAAAGILTPGNEGVGLKALVNGDDDEKDDVGESKVGALKGKMLVGAGVKGVEVGEVEGGEGIAGLSSGGKEVLVGDGELNETVEEVEKDKLVEVGDTKDVDKKNLAGEVVEVVEVSGGKDDEKVGEFEEAKSVEVNDVKFTGNGDSFAEDSDVKGLHVASANGSLPVHNEFEGVTQGVEGPEELDVESKKTVEISDFKIEDDEVKQNGVDVDSHSVGQSVNPELAVTDDAGVENAKNLLEREVIVDKGGEEIGVISTEEKLMAEMEPVAGLSETAESHTGINREVTQKGEDEDDEKHDVYEDIENEGSVTDAETDDIVFGSPEAAKQFLEELERASGVGSHSGTDAHDDSQRIDGQIVTDSDEEADTDDEGEGKQLFDSAALAALLKAATSGGADGNTITVTSQDGSRLFSVERPAGLGSSLRSAVKPAPRTNHANLFGTSSLMSGGDSDSNLSEEEKKKLEELQRIRVKFLRLVHRLGLSPEESTAAQVLYRLALVAGRQTNQFFSLDAAKRTAMQLEAESKDDLNFSLNILVLGKAGVGKSATINSIFGEEKSPIDAFQLATTSVREITGTVDGVRIRVIDTPGLKTSGSEQGANRKILSSVKKFIKKSPPDIVVYVDRLDTQTRDLNDLPLLRSITAALGSSIWRSAIVTLTHAASAPPDGPSGSPLSYEVFVAQRSHVVQQSIGQAVGNLRLMNPSLMNPVCLAENHPSCRKNRDGQKVLPNGQTWRPQLLLLSYSMKILAEASLLSKSQDPLDQWKLFGSRARSPPLPYLLSWLLQSRTHPKLSADQGGDGVDSDVDVADLSDSDQEEEEEEDEYDQLPPFKPLKKAQLAKLSNEQKKAYFEEYDYRVKLLQKKHWKEELKRMREMKKKGKVAEDEYGYMGEEDPENAGPAAVPVPLPDMVLPPSFDGDNPAYRYRFLEPTSQFLARPVLDTHGWDHDCGYDGVNVEHGLAILNRFPTAVTVQVTKDKKEFNIHLDSSIAAKHGENGSSMAGFDIQNVGKQLAYIVRGETKFKNLKKNKTTAGMSITFLGKSVATGLKVEDQIALGKRLVLVGSTGTVRSQGDAAYGANLEVRLREADFPIGQDQSSLGLSLVKWRGDLALGANLQSQISVGRSSKIAVRAGLNNKMSGQITIRTSSSEQLQIALVGLLPIVMSIYKTLRPGVGESYMY